MKKIFTLLFLVTAMALTASAQGDGLVEKCVNVVLGKTQPTTMIMATNLDVNQDGAIDIEDVTLLIQAQIEEAKKAPQQELIDVDDLIEKALNTNTGEPNVDDVSKAIDHNMKRK